jgi:hypothetical protein
MKRPNSYVTDSVAGVAKRELHDFQISGSESAPRCGWFSESFPFSFFTLVQLIISIKGNNDVAENVK